MLRFFLRLIFRGQDGDPKLGVNCTSFQYPALPGFDDFAT